MKRIVVGLLFGFAFQATAVAHLLDEYVQAAKITLIPTGVGIELRLSPGVELADRIFATIDGDRNGQISTTEEQAYAQRVVQDLTLEVNDRAVPLILTSVQFPSRHEMNEGIGAIRLSLIAEVSLSAVGEHQVSFRNEHLSELSTYLANATIPTTDTIEVTAQQRDPQQQQLQVNFSVLSPRMRAKTNEINEIGVLLFVLVLCLALLSMRWRHFLSSQSRTRRKG